MKLRRRWFQYSLRSFLVVLIVLAVWLGVIVNRAREQREAVKAIEELGGSVGYDWQDVPLDPDHPFWLDSPLTPPGPAWLRRLVGNEFFQDAVEVEHFVVQLDFDGGTLRFFEKVSTQKERLGSPLTIAFNGEHCPTIKATIGEKYEDNFVIDTGATYMAIESGLFDRMVEGEEIIPGASSALATVAGNHRARSGKLLQMSIDGFALKGLRTDRDAKSSIGLRLLSRFLVTFDFPNGTLYLKSGETLADPDPPATSGLVLIQRQGKTLVKAVKPNGPADKAGIQAGDELLAIDAKSSSGLDLFDLGTLLTSEVGKKVRLRLRRNDDEIEQDLELADRYRPAVRASKPKN